MPIGDDVTIFIDKKTASLTNNFSLFVVDQDNDSRWRNFLDNLRSFLMSPRWKEKYKTEEKNNTKFQKTSKSPHICTTSKYCRLTLKLSRRC